MADTSRIDELRRRLQKDPASIAFAQLAEEYRRAGKFQDAVETCRAGLRRHSGYLSARVTLGRSLLELGDLDGAYGELSDVLRTAPQNLAAIRGLAEVHRRRGELHEALDQYRTAFELAQNDPGIDMIVRELRRQVGPDPVRPAPRPAGAAVPPAAVPVPAALPPEAPSPLEVRKAQAARLKIEAHLDVLERWLAALLEDRRSRLYGRVTA